MSQRSTSEREWTANRFGWERLHWKPAASHCVLADSKSLPPLQSHTYHFELSAPPTCSGVLGFQLICWKGCLEGEANVQRGLEAPLLYSLSVPSLSATQKCCSFVSDHLGATD